MLSFLLISVSSRSTSRLVRLFILVTILTYIVSRYVNRDLIVSKIMPLISLVRPRKFSSFYCLLSSRNKTIIHRYFYSTGPHFAQGVTDDKTVSNCQS